MGRSLVIGVLLVSALLISQEYMVNDGPARASLAVPGIAFYGDQNQQEYEYDISSGTAGSVIGVGGSPFLFAPVYFSPGYNRVKKMTMTYYDNTADAQIAVNLYRKNLATGESEHVVNLHSPWDPISGINTVEVTVNGPQAFLAVIDNSLYSWYLGTELEKPFPGENLEIHQITIEYGN